MPNIPKLVEVFAEVRRLAAQPDNDFMWSSWRDAPDALEELDGILATLRAGVVADGLTMRVIFAPTGPLQELALSSGFGNQFMVLANRFDEALAENPHTE